MREPERSYNPDKFTIRLAAFFNMAKDEQFLASSLRIRCKNTKRFTESDFSLYVKGNRNGTLLPPKSNLIEDSFHIPCTTTTPLEPVTLFKVNGNEEVEVEDVDYIPWYGFLRRYKKLDEGVYFCRQGSSEIRLMVKNSPKSETVSFIPWWEDKVRSFSDKEIYFSCYSNSNEKVELKFEGYSKLNINYSKNSTWDKSVKISPIDKNSKRIEGKVSCWKKDILVKQWTFEFIKAPEIYLDDHFNKIHCLTDLEEVDGVEVEAKSLSCENDVGCRYYQKCLGEGLVCDHLERVVYSNKGRTQCAPLVNSKGRVCVNRDSWNGVAQCTVNGLSRTWSYFTALDLRTYTDWNKVDENDLLRLEKDKENGFRCIGVGFLFANSLGFELEYRNKSTELLQGEGEDGKVTIHEHPNPYKIQGFQVVSSLELFKPENIKSIKCVGSFWNSTEIVKTPAYNL